MFLRERATQAEYFDLPGRTQEEIAASYRELSLVNKLFVFAEPFQRYLPRWLGQERCRSLSILDLGAGDGLLSRTLTQWAAKRGWNWRIVNLDINPKALALDPHGLNVAGSATTLPFPDNTFDVVIATQMTHHLLNDEDVSQHFREAWRVSKDLILVSDMHRSWGLYVLLYVVLRAPWFSKHFREDGLLSVQRGWRVEEWQSLAEKADIPDSKVHLYFWTRVCLHARKPTQLKALACSVADDPILLER